MLFQIGMENGDENRSVAWVLSHPGCFAYGPDPAAALSAIPQALREYDAWIAANNGESWLSLEGCEIRLDESWQAFGIDENYELDDRGIWINAWFRHDWKPLTAEDIQRGLKLLAWSRADLEETAWGLSAPALEHSYPGERWNITGILRHVAGAEWWYLDRLGLAIPREQIPEDTWQRLAVVRERLNGTLPGLEGLRRVIGVVGEFWSPRKLLRRAVWHERDHTQHIRKLLAGS